MKELTSLEMEMVSGAGLASDAIKFTSGFIGDAIIDTVKVSNDFLNTRTISSVGKVFDAVGPGLHEIHEIADTLGYATFKGVAAFGGALGGDESRIDYHYDTEWS